MPNKVCAKVVCDSVVAKSAGGSNVVYDVTFYPVTHGSEENEQFFKYTPSGRIELGGLKSPLFDVGKEYYLDFIPAE